MRARLFLGSGAFLYVGPGFHADDHAHHAVQLAWAATGTLDVALDGGRLRARAALIPSQVRHALDAGPAAIAVLLVEAHGGRGVALDRRARELAGVEVGDALAGLPFPALDMTPEAAAAWCEAAVDTVARAPVRSPLSSVSRRAVAFIETHLDGVPRLGEAAAAIGVSPTRLTHVFSREVGIPFRRFVLWARMKRAVDAVRRGADLTGAAFAAGFSDAAHLSRTFRDMFGMNPSQLLSAVEIVGDVWHGVR